MTEPGQSPSGASSRYLEIAHGLRREIEQGTYPVGASLPTETALCRTFGVSRHTVRDALRVLDDQGYILRRQGSGTQVIASKPHPEFRQSFSSLHDLLQYAVTTHIELGPGREIVAKGRLSRLLDCAPSRRWHVYSGVRYDESGAPFCTTDVYVDPAISGIETRLKNWRKPIYELIEHMYDRRVAEVRQEISAVILDDETVHLLNAEPGSAALQIVRRYFDDRPTAFEVAVSLHPTDRLTYAMRIRRDNR